MCQSAAAVTALAQYNSFNDGGWLEGLFCLNNIRVITRDMRDPHLCLDLMREIDVVFHLAALIPIPYSHRVPSSYIDTNVTGTLNLCQASVSPWSGALCADFDQRGDGMETR